MSMRVRRRDGDAKNNRVRGTYGFGSGKHLLQIHTNIAKYYINIYIYKYNIYHMAKKPYDKYNSIRNTNTITISITMFILVIY